MKMHNQLAKVLKQNYKLLTLFFISYPIFAVTPVLTNVDVPTIRDNTIVIRWITSVINTGTTRCWYGYSPLLLDRRMDERNKSDGGDNSGRRQCELADLTPNTKVYFSPQNNDQSGPGGNYSTLLACASTCTNCTSAQESWAPSAGGAANCDNPGEFPYVTTSAEDLNFTPTAPTHDSVPEIPPNEDAQFPVTDCANFDSQKLAAENAAIANPGTVQALVVDEGLVCTPTEFRFKNIVSSGSWVVVRSGTNPNKLPASGTMITPDYIPKLAKITRPNLTSIGKQFFTRDAGAGGYYIHDIDLSPPDLNSSILTPYTINISSIDTNTDIITIPSGHGLDTASGIQIVIANFDGTGIIGGYGPVQACFVTSTTLRLRTGVQNYGFCNSQGTQANLIGPNCSGSCGTLRRAITQPIQSFQDCGDGQQCLTVTGHGIANYPNTIITSGTTSTITLADNTGYQMGGTNIAIHISGTGKSTCDGLRKVIGVAGTILTVTRANAVTDCSLVTTGTAHRHRAFSLYKTSSSVLGGFTAQSHNMEVIDQNTLRILEQTVQSGASGGYLFWDVDHFMGPMPLGRGGEFTNDPGSTIVLDRVVMNNCIPWHNLGGISLGDTSKMRIINSHLEICQWNRHNPIDPDILEFVHGMSQANENLSIPGTNDTKIVNNNLWPYTFIFADDDSTPLPQNRISNLTLKQNIVFNPDWSISSIRSDNSYRNHYFRSSFCMELKSAGENLDLSANYWKGCRSNFQIIAPAIGLSQSGSNSATPNGFTQVAIQYNIFERLNAILQVTHATGFPSKMKTLAENLDFSYNLAVKIDTPRYSSSPGNTTGLLISNNQAIRHFTVRRNTYIPYTVTNPTLLEWGHVRSNGMRYIDNILGLNTGPFSQNQGIRQDTTGFNATRLPQPINVGGKLAFDEYYVRGIGVDPKSEWTGNVALPMLVNSTSGVFSTLAASNSPTITACRSSKENDVRLAGFSFTWIGNNNNPCNESLNERFAQLFEPNSFQPIATFIDKGAPIDLIKEEFGLTQNILVTVDGTSVFFNYHAPSTVGCTIKIAPKAASWMASWDDESAIQSTISSSGNKNQSVSFTSLAQGNYWYRGDCTKEWIGEFTIQ